ncbi:hypothetical protein BN946_scf185007.g197 [Trametes cinnabarina]|uniref:Uncharacterized protein n=1 Tax=Pycnoporus cinnabarinus TaxID=5643 RepID=A0A060SF37_PYCCI|nr:hypothetical protein BN946_scf185007.g197 [Trametes cinnabarina]
MAASTRRRVNPESLAVRLGPELVRELESYVKPGEIEMPSFAIRQQIQMRHKVDRRHIYDWFHSKGLRVTKEDKRATVEQKTGAMRMQRQIRRTIAPAMPSVAPCPSLSDGTTDSAPPSPALLTPPVVPAEFHHPLISQEKVPIAAFLDHHGAFRRKVEDFHTVDPSAWLEGGPTQASLTAHQTLRQMSSTLDLPPRPPPGYSRKFREPEIDVIFMLDESVMSNSQQREACYNVLSRVLGPANGVQECVGTYMAHMSRQREIYYGDFLPDAASARSVDKLGLPVSPASGQVTPSVSQDVMQDTLSLQQQVLQEALNAVFNLSAFSMDSQLAGAADTPQSTNESSPVGSAGVNSLVLDDLLASPVLRDSETPQGKTVTFAPEDKVWFRPRLSGYLSPPVIPSFDSSSSSLAGALGECSATLAHMSDHAVRRKSKEWVRPRMGRARAYSGGGGM